MTNSDRLQEIRERVEKATPGPWKYYGKNAIETPPIHADEADYGMPDKGFEGGYRFNCWADPGAWRYADGEFIAASREDIPYLLQFVTEQQREIDRLKGFVVATAQLAACVAEIERNGCETDRILASLAQKEFIKATPQESQP